MDQRDEKTGKGKETKEVLKSYRFPEPAQGEPRPEAAEVKQPPVKSKEKMS